MKYIQSNLKYPEAAKAAGAEGKAFVQFVVKADGSIENVEIMRSSGDASLDAEALRVVKAMPKWRPAMNKGEAVNVKFVLPIVYKLPKEVNGNGVYVPEQGKEKLLVVSGGAVYDGDINDIDPETIESIEIVNNNLEFIKNCEYDIKAVSAVRSIIYSTGEFDVKVGKIITE